MVFSMEPFDSFGESPKAQKTHKQKEIIATHHNFNSAVTPLAITILMITYLLKYFLSY